ncbi:MAG: DUF6308 family protein [Actinomycetota bacterium]
MTRPVDEDLGRRLLAGPLRAIDDSLSANGSNQRFSPADALSTYFHGTPRQFSGSLFDSFGGGGDRPEVENQITSDDLLAVAAVNAAMPAVVTNQLLSEPLSGRLTARLRQLATDVDLWDAEDEVLTVAAEAYEQIRSIHPIVSGYGEGWAAANKLLARKRPRLIPMYDAKVRRVANLAEGASWWFSLRHAMHVDGEDNEIRYRVCAAMREADIGYVSVLRGLDVILWSYAKWRDSAVYDSHVAR